ncbi:MAG TPA: hypothetical protein PLX73_02610, partial [Candidatus Paceibacterota bacterium]|nr:hypothetical protein [Candidatus Paceibacterota bacterium]
QRSKIKDQKDNNSKLKAQSSKLQLKTQNHLFCHPERSEGSLASYPRDSSLTLRMACGAARIFRRKILAAFNFISNLLLRFF